MKSDDEYVEIKLNSIRIKNIKNKELKEKANQMSQLNLGIVNMKLKTSKIETLITNIPQELASPTELKKIIREKMANRERI
ncbi:MAG: hypothetical protein LBB45_08020 [Methanobrevibacter sp.]|nr:hypothetical protein [Candidatus Methanovirga basalitermitum]